MEYVCVSCRKPTEIPVHAAWPDGCPYCGGTVWTGPPADPLFPRVAPSYLGSLDTVGMANGLLRQPGSALDSFRNTGAIPTPH